MSERHASVRIPEGLVEDIDAAVARGDAASREELVANAVLHELLRLREAEQDRAAMTFLDAQDKEPEQTGAGWDGMMQDPSDAPIPRPPQP